MKNNIVGALSKLLLVGTVLGVLGGCAVYVEPLHVRPYHGYYR